jgi:hypothetical protein
MVSTVPQSALTAAVCLSLLCSGARAGDLFVPGDHATIQAAIDASVDGDTIHVGPGTWPGALATLDRDITILGAGADVTIIDGQGAAQTLLVGVNFEAVVVRHVTLTGGIKGITTAGSSHATLSDSSVRGNTGVGGSGRIVATDSTFADNGSHGLAPFLSALRCTFLGNGGWGVEDIDNIQTGPYLGSSFFAGNAFGGARLGVLGNSVHTPPEMHVGRCIFQGNTLQVATLGPSGEGTSYVSNCSMTGATLKIMQGTAFVTSSILRGSQPITDLSATGGAYTEYSNVQGGLVGAFFNIDADPLWADAENGDFSLLPGSPCINSGHEGYQDMDGTRLDMGALPYDPWTTLDGSVAGAAGTPRLTGTGAVQAGFELELTLTHAPAAGAVLLVVGLQALQAPFKGGTLWPSADVLVGPLLASPAGTLTLAGTWPAGLPSGFSFWSQTWIADAGAPFGFSASNGLRGVQP